MHLHAPQAKIEHIWLFVWANGHVEKLDGF
jgi:hypothetical protein